MTKPIKTQPDNKESYNKLLKMTRRKQIAWQIKTIKKGNTIYSTITDGQNISLIRRNKNPIDMMYAFVNLPGQYRYDEYRALENAILSGKISNSTVTGVKKSVSVNSTQTLTAASKESSIQKQCRAYWEQLKKATSEGRCKWIFEDVSRYSRSFKTKFNKNMVSFTITIKDNKKDRTPTYYIKPEALNRTLSIGQKNGVEFERFLLANCSYSNRIIKIPDCQIRTAVEYADYLEKIDRAHSIISIDNLKKISLFRYNLYNGLCSLLLKQYRTKGGIYKTGMDILASDKDGHRFESVIKTVLPYSVKEFSENAKSFLSCINVGYGTMPEISELYREILDIYAAKYAEKKILGYSEIVLPQETVNDFANKLTTLQNTVTSKTITVSKKSAENSPTEAATKPVNPKTITDSVNPETKHVNAHDFVIRSSVLSCMYRSHSIVNIDAEIVIVNKKQVFSTVIVPAGYCQQCQKYFILEVDYARLISMGTPLCTVIDERRYKEHYRNESYFSDISSWPEQSILRKCGYNVNQASGLTTLERRKILANVIDHEILSKLEIRSHIQKQIALQSRHLTAVDKWESDDDFVASYNKGYYTKYGVKTLRN